MQFEAMVELENHHVAILNEKMDLGNNHQWKLKPLEKGRGGTFIMDLQTDAFGWSSLTPVAVRWLDIACLLLHVIGST